MCFILLFHSGHLQISVWAIGPQGQISCITITWSSMGHFQIWVELLGRQIKDLRTFQSLLGATESTSHQQALQQATVLISSLGIIHFPACESTSPQTCALEHYTYIITTTLNNPGLMMFSQHLKVTQTDSSDSLNHSHTCPPVYFSCQAAVLIDNLSVLVQHVSLGVTAIVIRRKGCD